MLVPLVIIGEDGMCLPPLASHFISGFLQSPYWLPLAFSPKTVGGGKNGALSFYQCMFSGGDTQEVVGHSKQILCLNFLHSQVPGMQILWA